MMDCWRGKVAMVTGASQGIGAAIACKLVEEGLQVVGLARSSEKLQELSKNLSEFSGQFHPIKCDVSNEEEVLEAFKWIKDNLGVVQILINNAGILREGFLYNGSTEDWRKMFATNVLGLMLCTREAVSSMSSSGAPGHVVHINSIAGHGVPLHTPPDASVYPATKHAVSALSAVAMPRGVKVTSVSPGLTFTGMYTEDKLPCLQPQDVADAVMFALGTPPHVQITEIIIKPTGEDV